MNSESLKIFRDFLNPAPEWAVVLGSGLADIIPDSFLATLPFSAIPELPQSKIKGHQNRFVLADLEGIPVLYQQGRLHLYEDLTPTEVTLPIRLMAETSVSKLILTNAAGSLNPSLSPGTIVQIQDHINLQASNPLIELHLQNPFLDMSQVWQQSEEIDIPRGVYAGVTGPAYETNAEASYLRIIGADMVGMSTVQEAILAHAFQMKIYGFSLITNFAGGNSNHQEVLQIGEQSHQKFQSIIKKTILKRKKPL